MTAQRFLILHGWQGSGGGHWQTLLAERLGAAGHPVRYPDLPECHTPCPDRWGRALREEVAALGPGPGSVVICHSLACVLWLRHARATRGEQRVERVALVAPPSAGTGISEIARFYPVTLDREAIAASAVETRLVCSDDDPYCPGGAAAVYGEPLGLATDVVAGGGHLNPDAGYGPWPEMEAWSVGRRAHPAPVVAPAYGAKNGVDT